MKDSKMNYVEMPGEDHGTIISKGMPDIFAFFKAQKRINEDAPGLRVFAGWPTSALCHRQPGHP